MINKINYKLRIRTIKPSFFKHYLLYKAERQSGLPLRLAYIGLWLVADREGRFPWKSTIKNDILPYDQVNFSKVLEVLHHYGFIAKYRVANKTYGVIPTFTNHQRIGNREPKSKLPPPSKGLNTSNSGILDAVVCHTPPADPVAPREDDRPLKSEVPGKPRCPTQKIIDTYHQECPDLPQVRSFRAGSANLRARWQEDRARQNLGWWQEFFRVVHASDFLCGRLDNPWIASFNWIIRPQNFEKILNGNFSRRQPSPNKLSAREQRNRDVCMAILEED